MRSRNEHDGDKQADLRELDILLDVQATPKTSQRDIAGRLGISLGLTNLLLRNIARKGYGRVTRAGWRRWLACSSQVAEASSATTTNKANEPAGQ